MFDFSELQDLLEESEDIKDEIQITQEEFDNDQQEEK